MSNEIKNMVNRFLGWRLPKDFSPDNGIKFTPFPSQQEDYGWPVGTNIFTADQAEAMLFAVAWPEIKQIQAENAALRAEAAERREDHMKLVEENHELRQQLAASQLEAKRLRDTMQKIAGHPEETPPFYWWQIYARNALSSPTSTDALDAYVAEKVKEAMKCSSN